MCVKMKNSTTLAAVKELLRRIEEIEYGHARIKHQIFNLINSPNRQTSNEESAALQSFRHCPPLSGGGATKLTEAQYFNILQSIDEPIHVTDSKGCVVYRNRAWEELYGYTESETYGKDVIELMVEAKDAAIAKVIMQQILNGDSHGGEFVVRNKKGERLLVLSSSKPLRDENGTIIGIIAISTLPRPSRKKNPELSIGAPTRIASQQPLQSDFGAPTRIASQQPSQSDLDSKFMSKMKKGDDQMCYQNGKGELSSTTNSDYNKPRIHDNLYERAERMFEDRIPWPWNEHERKGGPFDSRSARFCWHWLQCDQEYVLQMFSSIPAKVENLPSVNNTLETWYCSYDKVYEIKWEDLMIIEHIGRGSYGSVFHAMWNGSDVALKIFSKQEYSHDLIFSFRQEVSIMKRLRHPNILLFMGTVISPQRLGIVTEFLPRGSLFKLLRRIRGSLNWKRRVHMAMDIARGMNYLHNCLPPIIHGDLKSSNLLVDKNWTVKIGDFGLCQVKYEIEERIRTPEWMAPEVLLNEEVDEKSDVYSYGVVLWEITTEKIPWEGLNLMQVIEAVGFMNQRLNIPKDVDPQWASLIERCLHREPKSRPTFQEILSELKTLQKRFTEKVQAPTKRLISRTESQI